MYVINTQSHDFSRAIWDKQAVVNFFKDHKIARALWARTILLVSIKKFTRAYLFQIALEIM